jgi:hydroxymethylglutaryl-CoA lyase
VDRPVRPELPGLVTIREVGPRDGLQSERPLPVEERATLIEALAATGVPEIEAVSFVSPKAVPAMADATDVWARVRRDPSVAYSALVPNARGAQAAVDAGGFASLQAFLGVADGYNRANVGKSVQESMGDVRDAIEVGADAGVPVEVSISAAFGDPYDGDVEPERVRALAAAMLDAGAAGISLGDTTGMATPARVWDVAGLLLDRLPGVRLNLHLHDTRGTAMANALAALELGVTRFDASIGGLGGSPFAQGVNGNLATEDLVHMLDDMGIRTGANLERLIEVAGIVAKLVGHEVPSRVSGAGPRIDPEPEGGG